VLGTEAKREDYSWDMGCSSVVEGLSRMHEALGSTLALKTKTKAVQGFTEHMVARGDNETKRSWLSSIVTCISGVCSRYKRENQAWCVG
jgi:hypothetical protein